MPESATSTLGTLGKPHTEKTRKLIYRENEGKAKARKEAKHEALDRVAASSGVLGTNEAGLHSDPGTQKVACDLITTPVPLVLIKCNHR